MQIITSVHLILWAMSLSAVLYSSYTLFAPTNKSVKSIDRWFIVFFVSSIATLSLLIKIVISKSLGLNVSEGSAGGIAMISMTLATVVWLILKTLTALKEMTGNYRFSK